MKYIRQSVIKSRPTPLDSIIRKIIDNRKNILNEFKEFFVKRITFDPSKLEYHFTDGSRSDVTEIRVSLTPPLNYYPTIYNKLEIYDFFFDIYCKYRDTLLKVLFDETSLRSKRDGRGDTNCLVKLLVCTLNYICTRMSEDQLTRDELSDLYTIYRDSLRNTILSPNDTYLYLLDKYSNTSIKDICHTHPTIESNVLGGWYRYVYKLNTHFDISHDEKISLMLSNLVVDPK